MQVTYAPDKSWLFWLQENPENPQFEPHVGIKMEQVLPKMSVCAMFKGVLHPWPILWPFMHFS